MMPNGAASLQGPGMPALSPEQMQMMLQQQALAAAMAAGGAGLPGMTGLPMGLPPGISLEQASLMGLPIMNMLPGGTSAAAQLGFAAGGVGVPGSALPGLVGADGMPSHLAMPGMASSGGAQLAAAPAAGGGGDGKSSDNDEFTATGRRKRKDTGEAACCGAGAGGLVQLGSACTRLHGAGGRWCNRLLTIHQRLAGCRQAAAAVTQLDGRRRASVFGSAAAVWQVGVWISGWLCAQWLWL